jgi:hypothetical protein
MNQECLPVVKPTIEKIQEQFILWRNTRRCRGSVPEQLWEAAVSLAGDYSIGHICKVLGLNHRQLKRRVQEHNGNGYPEEERSCHFVELAVSSPEADIVSSPPGANMMSKPEESGIEYVLEMEDQKGGKLRVHMKGEGSGFNPLEVVRAFWGRDK